MTRFLDSALHWRGLLAVFTAVVLTACGGGGGGGSGGERDLVVDFSYAGSSQIVLYDKLEFVPRIVGLQGNSPTCSLVEGSKLPPGTTLGSNCEFQGATAAVGSYSGSVRLTVSGYRGEVTTSYYINVVTPNFQSYGDSPRLLNLGEEMSGAPSSSQVASLGNYSPRTGDQTELKVSEGQLPKGISIDLVNANSLVVKGTPTEVGVFGTKVTFSLQRGGHVLSASIPLSFQVAAKQLTLSYEKCCEAYTGVSMRFIPTTNFAPFQGATILFKVSGGSLPAGTQLDPASGDIFGVPSTGERNNLGASITASVTFNGAVVSQAESVVFFYPVGVFGTYPLSSQGTTANYDSGMSPPYSVSHRVAPGIPFTIEPGTMYGGRPGDVYRYRLVKNRNYLSAVPTWVSIDSVTGVISGLKPRPDPTDFFDSTATFEIEVTLTRNSGTYKVNQYFSIS